jgi:hypothetical protein
MRLLLDEAEQIPGDRRPVVAPQEAGIRLRMKLEWLLKAGDQPRLLFNIERHPRQQGDPVAGDQQLSNHEVRRTLNDRPAQFHILLCKLGFQPGA